MKKRNTKQVILPLITSFIWGSSFVAQSLGAGKVGGFTFTAARSIPAVLVLGARGTRKNIRRSRKRTCWRAVSCAAFF